MTQTGNKTHRMIKVLLTLLVGCLLLLVTLIVIAFSGVPWDQLSVGEEKEVKKQTIEFEEGALAKRLTFDLFQRLTNQPFPFPSYEEQSIQSSANQKELEFQKSLTLTTMVENYCTTYRCLQLRIPFYQIPSVIWKGLIGIEDYRFTTHSGIDPWSILRALITDLKSMRFKQGGSTLTQQLVKNLLLTNQKTLWRKFREVLLSLYIEHRLSKSQILTLYFNEVYWGALQGVKLKGIVSASLGYFSKLPIELESYEASILVSLLKGPSYYHPIRHLERLQKRTQVVFERLKDLGLVPSKAKAWSTKKWSLWHKKLEKLESKKSLQAFWWALKLPNSHYNLYERFVLTSSILETQQTLEKYLEGAPLDIKVLLRSRKPKKESYALYSKQERNLERAIEEERHQVGSTLKPFWYFLLQQNGKEWDDSVSTAKLTLELLSGKWSPKEATKKTLPESVTMREALQRSLNRPLVRLASEIGFDRLEQLASEWPIPLQTPLKEYPAQLLGSLELSLSELSNLYGMMTEKICQRIRAKEESWEESLVGVLAGHDQTTIRFRVRPELAHQRFFGKTGTSNQGFDAWYVGVDGKQVMIIWVGFEGDRAESKGFTIGGSSAAFPIFQEFQLFRGKRVAELSCLELVKKK